MPDAPAANRFPVSFDGQTLLRLCQTYRVAELSLFGSVTRDDFDQARSDVDVLVEFLPDTPVSGWVWFERYSLFTLEEALEEMFHRQVDLLDKKEIDPYVRDEVLGSRVVVYRSSPGLLREPGALYDGSPGGNAPAGAPGTDAPGGGGTDSQTAAEQTPEGGTVRKPPGPLGPEKAKAIKKQGLYLCHMRDDCRYLLQTTAQLTYEDFVRDRDKQLVVGKLLEEIGENANKLDPLLRESHPGIGWKEVINLRNKRAHAYRHTMLYSIWRNKEKIPELLAGIETLIQEVAGPGSGSAGQNKPG